MTIAERLIQKGFDEGFDEGFKEGFKKGALEVAREAACRLRDMGCAKWHLNRSQFGIRIDHDLASISDHSLASQSITIWHASDH
ncbi:TPA: hypothetical protein ACWQLH_003170 [Escherichia coli]